MPRKAAGLTAQKVTKAGPGRYGDGNGLYLLVRPSKPDSSEPGGRFWIFRYHVNAKLREMGLGRAPGIATDKGAVTLAEARARAGDLFKQVRSGVDPLAEKKDMKAAAAAVVQREAVARKTFREVAEKYIEAKKAGWGNLKHAYQWRQSLAAYAFPYLGDLPVAEVETEHVVAALELIWITKPETATRVRGRIEAILNFAKARGWRTAENPARWRGHLADLLPPRGKIAPVQHQPALPWLQIATFMGELRQRAGSAALALEFTILTAARTGETLGARWGEIDLAAAAWTVPPARMKMKKEHRVPLTDAAMAVLRQAADMGATTTSDAYVFPGARLGAGLSAMALMMLMRRMGHGDLTVHGFRSTFRDWAAESTAYPREIAEKALAHALRDKTEAAYQRGDLFEKRRRMMDDWATFCARAAGEGGQVVPIRAQALTA